MSERLLLWPLWLRVNGKGIHCSAIQSFSVSPFSISSLLFSWLFTPHFHPQNVSSDLLHSIQFNSHFFLTLLPMENTNMPFPVFVLLAIPLFFSQVFLAFSAAIFDWFLIQLWIWNNGFFFFFTDYKRVEEEIQEFCRNSTALGSKNLNYIQGNAETFGGNFSFQKRISYFHHNNQDGIQIPCGFFKKFPISSSG